MVAVVEGGVVGGGEVVVVEFVVVFLVIGVENTDDGVTGLVVLLMWPWCLVQ